MKDPKTGSYYGGKGSIFRHHINLQPPHSVYITMHLGGGSVLRNKRPAALNISFDLDAAMLGEVAAVIAENSEVGQVELINPPKFDRLRSHTAENSGTRWQFICSDSTTWLDENPAPRNALIFADPPYVLESRKDPRGRYIHEFTEQDHIDLLTVLKKQSCHVQLCGYDSELYRDMLPDWHVYTFEAVTRGGTMATEFIWMNYPPPTLLHTTWYLGKDYREREKLKRRANTAVGKFERMSLVERQMTLSRLAEAGLLEGLADLRDTALQYR